jgi:hypothetical protein
MSFLMLEERKTSLTCPNFNDAVYFFGKHGTKSNKTIFLNILPTPAKFTQKIMQFLDELCMCHGFYYDWVGKRHPRGVKQ